MAAPGEADQLGTTSDSDPGELNEAEAPGKSEDAILLASDEFDTLTYDELAVEAIQPVQKGTIHAIARQLSHEGIDSRSNTPNHVDHDSTDVSAGEESVEESSEVVEPCLSSFTSDLFFGHTKSFSIFIVTLNDF